MKWFLLYYRPPMELLEGNAFTLCLSASQSGHGEGGWGPHVTITHVMHWTSLYRTHPHPSPAASDIRHDPGPSLPPVSDMGLPSPPTLPLLRTSVGYHLFIWKPPPVLTSRKILRWLAGGMHPTSNSFLLLNLFFHIYVYIPTSKAMFVE